MITRDTIHILSHPKAGRTWLRLLLSFYFQGHFELDVPKEKWLEVQQFHDLDERVPHVHFTHDRNAHLKPVGATRDKSMYADNHVIYLVRDPRDVIVSNYFQQNRREPVLKDAPAFPGTISEYIRDPQWGISHDIELMNIWAENRHMPREFRIVQYEDLHDIPGIVLISILAFAGIDTANLDLLHGVIKQCSFDSMQEMERTDALSSGRLRPTDADDPESFKTRRGRVSGYVDYLDEADIDYVNQEMQKLDQFFEYEI